ncbi:hypothetical protein GGI42DRAFT_367415 [Trichoderma sp. SZMC 28013]
MTIRDWDIFVETSWYSEIYMTDYTHSSEPSSSSDDEHGSTESDDTEAGRPAAGPSTDSGSDSTLVDSESESTLVDSGYGNSSQVGESGDGDSGDGETTSDSEPVSSDSDEHHLGAFMNQILNNLATEQDNTV